MRKNSTFVPFSCALVLVSAGLLLVAPSGVNAQETKQAPATRDRFVISAKAGGVNAVTGRIGVHARGSSKWEPLTIKDNLQGGDVVSTGLDGRVEILLNPGSYMRVAENSEFELTSNSLDNLEVRLNRGIAIVEATGADDTELLINITTPHTKMAIVRRGLYRLNVVPGDATELIVRKGRVLLADPETKIKGGKKLIFSGSSYSVAQLTDADKKAIDSFDNWSKERARTVAKANQSLTSRDRRFLRTGFSDDWMRRFSPRFSGIWLYQPGFNCYTFMPFYAGWGSPYGGSYSNSFYGYWWNVRNSPYGTQRNYYPSPGSSGNSIVTTPGGKGIPVGRSEQPVNRGFSPKITDRKLP
jgi:hypothetical protein